MVKPFSFTYNFETGNSNSFQNTTTDSSEAAQSAISEFEESVTILKEHGIEVICFEGSEYNKPDSVFPNNWIATTDEEIILFPMEAKSRREERSDTIVSDLKSKFHVKATKDFSYFEKDSLYCEGTGSMIFDHDSKKIYAALSSRTHLKALEIIADYLGFKAIAFETSFEGVPVYHTNVMMSIGKDIAVLCKSVITSSLDLVLSNLKESSKEIIFISEQQMQSFCGNILQLRNGESKFWIMSDQAKLHFNEDQLNLLSRDSKILSLPINRIEELGGGGVRCMMAEIFLNK